MWFPFPIRRNIIFTFVWIYELSTGLSDKTPSSKGKGSFVLKEEYFTYFAIGLEKTLEWLEEYDLSVEFTLHEVFIWETVNKKDLVVVSECYKE